MAGKKLPRKTMSMAKKGVAGTRADTGTGMPVPIVPNGTVLLGAGLALLVLVLVIGMARLIFPTANTDHSMLPAGYRAATGLDASDTRGDVLPTGTPQMQGDGRSKSPFPTPRGQEPIIVEVDCPAGTVQILTGDAPADTVCIRGQLADDDAPATPRAQRIIIDDGASIGGIDVPPLECAENEVIHWMDEDTDALGCVPVGVLAMVGASIGGTTVPPLDCAEDEVITFTAPDVLACVHYENVAPD